MRSWRFYSLLFFALWGVNVVISAAYILPSQQVKHILLRDAIAPALTALLLGLVHRSRPKQ